MSAFGHINEFDPKLESFAAWEARFKNYLLANDVPEQKYKYIFLATIGPQTYGTLMDIVQPDTPEAKNFDDLVKILQNYFQPKKVIAAERHKFRSEMQKPGQTVTEFATNLKHLAASCKFGSFLPDALKDQLIYGIRDSNIQKKLMETDLAFEEALQTAIMIEQVEKQSKQLQHNEGNRQDIAMVRAEAYEIARKEPSRSKSLGQRRELSQKLQQASPKGACTRCLKKNHNADNCMYKSYKCRRCHKVGHLAVACKTVLAPRVAPRKVNMLEEIQLQESTEEHEKLSTLWHIGQSQNDKKPYKITVSVNGEPLEMTVDCGAAVSVISEEEYKQRFAEIPVKETAVKLHVYGGKPLDILGEIPVQVAYNDQVYDLRLIVTHGVNKTNPPLLGREWLENIRLNWAEIFGQKADVSTVEADTGKGLPIEISEVLTKYSKLCEATCGEIKDFQVNLTLKPNYVPKFCKARPVPLALKEKVSTELDKLVQQKIIYPVRHSEWATPLVIVPKANGELRLCGDFRATVNGQIETEHYPLPSMEDIFNTVNNGKVFSVLDLSQAYLQLKVAEASQELLTINTHKGLYRYSRLPYGIAAAPMLFQATMDQMLQGIPNTMCYLDDILVAGTSKKDCQEKLDQVLRRLQEHNVRIRPDKCVWLADKVQYLGHLIDEQGIHPLQSKISTIVNTPTPRNVDDLRAYLGLLNYYGKFIPHLSTELHPLYRLLQKKVQWNWDNECEETFQKSKMLLNSNSVLVSYDPDRTLRLACDASGVGLGAVLSHLMDDGSERPIFFASKTLTPAEKNYSNIEREALAIVYGIKKFHKYLFGRRFQLVSDHKPLETIFGTQRTTSQMISTRLQRWSIALSAYQYDFIYRKGSKHCNADALSRLPCPQETEAIENPIFYFSPIRNVPLTNKDVRSATSKDQLLQQVKQLTLNGWPMHSPSPDLQPYFLRRNELSLEDDCILWGTRIVIPSTLQKEVLQMLHEGHQGICKTKSLARSYYWWPDIDRQIENLIQECTICQQTRPALPPTSLRPWPIPKSKWERIHVDLSVQHRQNVFLVVDAYSKWLDVEILDKADTISVIDKLRSLFAAYGLPKTVMSDNGPQFSSAEFQEFLQKNGIRHVFSPTYHPSSNGQIERMIQTFKNDIRRQILQDELEDNDRSLQHKIANFLFVYRTTPHSITEKSPAELFLGQPIRTRFDLLKPSFSERIQDATEKIKTMSDNRRRKDIAFMVGDRVWVYRSWARRKPIDWTEGQILKILGPTLFLVKVDRMTRRVHADYVRPRF